MHEPSTRVTPATTTVDDSPAGSSRKRRRSPNTSVPSVIPAPRDLSPTRVDLLPPCKRFRSSLATLSLEDSTEGSRKVGSEEEDVDTDIMADIAPEVAAADEIRIKTDVGFEGDDKDEEEAGSSERGTVEIVFDTVVRLEVSDDILVPTDEEGYREYFQMGLDMVIQELYDHMLELPFQRIVGIEEEHRA
ncbi:hypothetical protein Tco_0122130 [Tanacetum coccineum]